MQTTSAATTSTATTSPAAVPAATTAATPAGTTGSTPRKSGGPAPLGEAQQKTLQKLREALRVEERPTEEQKWLTDAELARFLRARDWDVSKSEALMRGALEWRFKTFRPHLQDPRAIAEEARTGKNYVSDSVDRQGRPILYMKPRFENTKNYADQIKYLVYNMELCIARMDERRGVEQWVWIIDYRDFSMSNAPPLSTSKETLNLISNIYPERLGLAFMIDPPFYFSIFWAAVYPFIPPVTQNKVIFVKGSLEAKRALLTEHIALDQLESDYGGTKPTGYSYDAYWQPQIDKWIAAHPEDATKAPAPPPAAPKG